MAQILCLVGPTASGKTQVALEIAKKQPVEIISCDSMQVYHSMPILTQALGGAHLAQFLDPARDSNADFFRRQALSLIQEIHGRKKTPLVVGGTGLYLRALLDGLFAVEEGDLVKDENLRQRLLEEQARHGGLYLHDRLRAVDPGSAEKIHPNDLRRIVRALEVFTLTGKPMFLQKQNRRGIREELEHRIFLLELDRKELYRRIDARVDRMVAEGLAGEVRALLTGGPLSKTARMALGIREIQEYLEGRCSLEEAARLLKQHTRNYAKRQLSWFRHEKGVETVHVEPSQTPASIASRILGFIA